MSIKKTQKITAVAMLVIAMLSTACNSQNPSSTSKGNMGNTAVAQTSISQTKAKQIALLDSGVSESETSFMRVDLKDDNSVYEVKFWGNSKAYEYVINANTGDIQGFRHDATVLAAVADGATMVDEAAAKKAALGYVGLSEADVVFGEVKLDDTSDGPNERAKWDVEFTKNNLQYSFDVDAYTSEVMSFEYDNLQHSNTKENSGNIQSTSFIGEAKAKENAFKDAGITESDATIMKLVLNTKGRRPVYDIEFHAKNLAYAYKIDAENGNISSFSSATMVSNNGTDANISASMRPEGNSGGSGQSGNTGSMGGANVQITADKAKEIALADAGVSANQATIIHEPRLEFDDGLWRYDVEFYSGNTEYDYEIDANTGRILSKDFDVENYNIPSGGNGGGANVPITADKAKEIALADAGVSANQATIIRQPKLEFDDGLWRYDVEFYSGNTEYDYEIDANTGKVLSKDFDVENYNIPSGGNGGANVQITADKAKEIALADAGVSANQVTIIRQPKLDFDDGLWRYDVEFYSGNTEYDYEIDANTGKILSKDFDVENYNIPSSGNIGGGGGANVSVTAERALQIALNRAGVSAGQAIVTKTELDYDDGRVEYEIEFISGNTEYEVTVDATTGAIFKFETDYND